MTQGVVPILIINELERILTNMTLVYNSAAEAVAGSNRDYSYATGILQASNRMDRREIEALINTIKESSIRRQELDTFQETLPRLLSQGKAVDEIAATAEVRTVIERVRDAMVALDLAASDYDGAEAELDALTRKALQGTQYEMPQTKGDFEQIARGRG